MRCRISLIDRRSGIRDAEYRALADYDRVFGLDEMA